MVMHGDTITITSTLTGNEECSWDFFLETKIMNKYLYMQTARWSMYFRNQENTLKPFAE